MPRIVRLELASLVLPHWHPEAYRSASCAVYGYAVDHPDGVILFDTGVGAGNDLIDELYDPDWLALEDALRPHSMGIAEVAAVVNSHLHFDHCGQNPMFYDTDVPFFIGRTEIAAVEEDSTYTVAEWALAPERQRRLIDDDLTIAEGVTVLAAPGHTSGHQALLVEAGDRRVVIAGQAVWNLQEFIDEVATESNVSTEEMRPIAVDTIRRLKALRPDRVLFAHCGHYTVGQDDPIST